VAAPFHAMPDDAATAVCASLSQCFNRTLEAVEEVVFLIYANDESLIVVVAAHFTPGHTSVSFEANIAVRCEIHVFGLYGIPKRGLPSCWIT
jgi:hypothetical protein